MYTDDAQGEPRFLPHAVRVDIRGLDDFATLLSRELETNFRPTSERVAFDHQAGVGFGANHASSEMQRARAKYLLCLHRALDNLATYIDTSEILITATKLAATAYRDADTGAADKADAIKSAIEHTYLRINAELDRTYAAARQNLADQRLDHLQREGAL